MTIAVRSGANVVPLTLAGLPIQYVAYWVRQLPRAMQEGAVALVRLMTGLRGAQVLPRSSHSPLDAIPVTGFQLADAISEGLIDVRSGVPELTADGARLLEDQGRSTHSAMKMFVSCGAVPWRFDAQTRCVPSGENIGNASNPGAVVTCSSPVPSAFTR